MCGLTSLYVSQFAVIYGSLACLVCVVVTMFLGLYTAQLALPMWCTIVMIVHICFHAGVELILAVHMHANKCCPSASSELLDNLIVMFKIHHFDIEHTHTLATCE